MPSDRGFPSPHPNWPRDGPLREPLCLPNGTVALLPSDQSWKQRFHGNAERLQRDFDDFAAMFFWFVVHVEGEMFLCRSHLASSWYDMYMKAKIYVEHWIKNAHATTTTTAQLRRRLNELDRLIRAVSHSQKRLEDPGVGSSVDAPIDAARRSFQRTQLGERYVHRCVVAGVPLTSHALVLSCRKSTGVLPEMLYAVHASYFGYLFTPTIDNSLYAPREQPEHIEILVVVRVFGYMRATALTQCQMFLASVARGNMATAVAPIYQPLLPGQLPLLVAVIRSFDAAGQAPLTRDQKLDIASRVQARETLTHEARVAAWMRAVSGVSLKSESSPKRRSRGGVRRRNAKGGARLPADATENVEIGA